MPMVRADRAVTPAGLVGPTRLEIEGDTIVAVELEATSTAGTRATTLVPGFVDIQVNGIADIDVTAAADDDWDRLDALLLAQGTTTWCPTLVTMPLDAYARPLARISAAASRSETDGQPRPHIARAHLEGPFLGGAPGAHPPQLIRPIDREWLAALPDAAAVITLGAEQADLAGAIADLVARGTLVSLGHSNADFETARAGARAGARLVTHAFNGMPGLHHRAPGLLGAALTDDRLCVSLIADLVHVHPAALQLAFRAKGPDRVVLVTDAVAWQAASVGGIGIEMRDGVPRLPDGTLAGSALTMTGAVANVVNECKVSLVDAIAAASSTPARLLGLADRGRLEPGMRADFVLLDESLAVAETWVGGRPAYARP